MKSIKRILTAVILIAVQALPLLAVTDKEMEEARAVTAKAYLRYVNNGSGYLDEVNAKSMAELTPKLKAKEKENLQAFNAVKVPTDYAGWDKKRLVEYWAATFFTSPGLDPNGKAARARVRKYIEGMTVTGPAAQESASEPKAQSETPASAEAAAAPTNDKTPAETPDAGAVQPEGPAQEPEDLLAEQQAIEKAVEESRENREPEQSNTWVYVLVLAILVGIVIWLVVYAANLMKRQPSEAASQSGGDREPATDSELREQTRKAIAAKNQELKAMQEQLNAGQTNLSDLQSRLEKALIDVQTLNDTVNKLKEENRMLRLRPQAGTESQAPEPARPASPRVANPATNPAPAEASPANPGTRGQAPHVIYLGRVNKRGIFVRGDRRFTPGHSIYMLQTTDGLVGTFQVVNQPEVLDLVLSDPEEYLGMGCTGEDLEDTVGVNAIATKSAGTAVFENGYWKVLRKTRIQYE